MENVLEQKKAAKRKRLLDAVWPVGSLYLSAADSDPGVLFGGTWQRVKDRFLLAAGDVYEPGETGGEAQHTLTKAEMPAHTHGYDFTGQSDVTGVTAIRLYDADGRRNEAGEPPTTICRRTWLCMSGAGRREKKGRTIWHQAIPCYGTAPPDRRCGGCSRP